MSAISDLERKIQSLKDQLSEARKSLDAAKREICPIKIGDIVLYRKGEYKVVEVKVYPWSPERPMERWNRPTIRGVKKLKNREWGTISHELWDDWVKVEAVTKGRE